MEWKKRESKKLQFCSRKIHRKCVTSSGAGFNLGSDTPLSCWLSSVPPCKHPWRNYSTTTSLQFLVLWLHEIKREITKKPFFFLRYRPSPPHSETPEYLTAMLLKTEYGRMSYCDHRNVRNEITSPHDTTSHKI